MSHGEILFRERFYLCAFIRALDNFGGPREVSSGETKNETGKTRVGILIGGTVTGHCRRFRRNATHYAERYFGAATSQKHDHRIRGQFCRCRPPVNNGGRSVRCGTTFFRWKKTRLVGDKAALPMLLPHRVIIVRIMRKRIRYVKLSRTYGGVHT